MDEPGASVGHATCTGFETAGWNANTQAGPLARFVAAHQQALLQQQATVAASAGQEQQVTGAQQALETDLATLQRANSPLTGWTSLTGAMNQMRHEYAQENLQVGGIQSVQTAVSNVNTDLSTLQSLHAAPTVNPASAIATGTTALASAWNSISAARGQGKTIITEAQSLAAMAQSLASQHGC
jgi:capsule polysaccharide export protein KpsE/RkpR